MNKSIHAQPLLPFELVLLIALPFLVLTVSSFQLTLLEGDNRRDRTTPL